MISLEKLKILTPSQKLPKNVGDLGKLIVATGFEKLPNYNELPNLVTLLKMHNIFRQEIASSLVRAKCYKNRHSIIFVAFDAEEVGCHGSLGSIL